MKAILSGEKTDLAKITDMHREKLLTNNLKATDEHLVDDLNCVLTSLQRQMPQVMLKHIDELVEHIAELDNDIDRHMRAEEKTVAARIQELPGIGNTSAAITFDTDSLCAFCC